MKIIKNILFIIAVIFTYTACENDLNTAPEDRFTTGSFYKNASDLEAAVNAAYGGLQKNGLYGFSWTYLFFGWFVPLFRGELGVAVFHIIFTVITHSFIIKANERHSMW